MINFSFQRYLLDFSAHLPLTLIVEHCIPIQYQGCTFLIKLLLIIEKLKNES